MLMCVIDNYGRPSPMCEEFPHHWGSRVKAACGVIGPEVEANWITKELEQYGAFDNVILRKSKEEAIEWLVGIGTSEATARCWADRFYL